MEELLAREVAESVVGALEPVEQQAAEHPGIALVGCVVTCAEKGVLPAPKDLDDIF